MMDRRLMFVDGKTQSSYSSSNRELRKIIDPDNSLLYVGVLGLETECGLSYDNHAQAMTVYDLCTGFIQFGVLPSRISVITPYSPHVKTIRTLLDGTGVSCNTVHKMLGSKNDIIIFATTISNHSKELGFMIQPELLNVATSRQLMKLIIVGDVGEIFAEGCDVSGKMYFIS
jgi:superfamily I DNA and/or RNA helicase